MIGLLPVHNVTFIVVALFPFSEEPEIHLMAILGLSVLLPRDPCSTSVPPPPTALKLMS